MTSGQTNDDWRTPVNRRKPIVVVGSINIDLVSVTSRIPRAGETVLGSSFQTYHGGKGANQAVAIARLGYPVRLIGRLGDDAFGVQLRTHLDESGVSTEGVLSIDGSSGVAVITVSAAGENSIVLTPGANAKVTPEDLDRNMEILRRAGMVLTQLEIPLETVECLANICHKAGIPIVLDPAPAAALPGSIFSKVTWLTPNQLEAASLLHETPEIAEEMKPHEVASRILDRGCRGVVLKMGRHGALLQTQEGLREFAAAFPVEAIDTTAAGDAFNGGFATALMSGKTPGESVRFAAAVAALSVMRAGAQASMPTLAETEHFLERQANGQEVY